MAKQHNGKIIAYFIGNVISAEITNESRALYDQSRWGEIKNNKIQYSLPEALYLLEKEKIEILDGKNKPLTFDNFVKKASKLEFNFWTRYCVFADLRTRGYIVKTALKFGADFRVYERGVKPGEDHAKWIVYPVSESSSFSWYEFAAKNRVAHSTRKRLLIGIVDAENDCTFYLVTWTRP